MTPLLVVVTRETGATTESSAAGCCGKAQFYLFITIRIGAVCKIGENCTLNIC
jgi:hypothetical protein